MRPAVLCAMRCTTTSLSVKDTRQKEEFQVSHLPGARHVEFDERNISELARSLDLARPGGWVWRKGWSGSVGWIQCPIPIIRSPSSSSTHPCIHAAAWIRLARCCASCAGDAMIVYLNCLSHKHAHTHSCVLLFGRIPVISGCWRIG